MVQDRWDEPCMNLSFSRGSLNVSQCELFDVNKLEEPHR